MIVEFDKYGPVVWMPPVFPDHKAMSLGSHGVTPFRAKIDGAPVNALVSDGKLIVASSTGKIYCFGEGEPTMVPDEPVRQDTVFGKQHHPSFPEGHALVFGWRDGTDPDRLLEHGKHQIGTATASVFP